MNHKLILHLQVVELYIEYFIYNITLEAVIVFIFMKQNKISFLSDNQFTYNETVYIVPTMLKTL